MRAEKHLLLDQILNDMKESSAFIITKYKHLTPSESWNLASELKKDNNFFETVKKRILKKALEKKGYSIELGDIKSHVGVVFAQDNIVDAAKAVVEFIKSSEDNMEIVSGHYDDSVCSAEDVKALAALPSEMELKAQFIGLLEAPLSQTLAVMEALLTSPMHCLENKIQKETK